MIKLLLILAIITGCRNGKDTAKALDRNTTCIDVGNSVYYCQIHKRMMLCDEDDCLKMDQSALPAVRSAAQQQERNDDDTNTSIIINQ